MLRSFLLGISILFLSPMHAMHHVRRSLPFKKIDMQRSLLRCLVRSISHTQKKYFAENFSELNVVYSPVLLSSLGLQQLKFTDPFPLSLGDDLRKLVDRYGPLLDKSFVGPVSVRWINDEIGFGLFAESSFKPGDFIGEYTGILQPEECVRNTVYCWQYPAIQYRGKRSPLVIDALNVGNYTRFVNHSDIPNAEVIPVFYKGNFHYVYCALDFIERDQQFLINYGPDYWAQRTKIDLKP